MFFDIFAPLMLLVWIHQFFVYINNMIFTRKILTPSVRIDFEV